jgi:hypothetical protein
MRTPHTHLPDITRHLPFALLALLLSFAVSSFFSNAANAGTLDALPAGPPDGQLAAAGALVEGGTFLADAPVLSEVTLLLWAQPGTKGRVVVLATAGGIPVGPPLWQGSDIEWPPDLPLRGDGQLELTSYPGIPLIPGNTYFVGTDFGLFGPGAPGQIFFVGAASTNPIPGGRAWGYIDGQGWTTLGGPNSDISARIVMTGEPSELVTWEFRGSIRNIMDPGGVLAASGVPVSPGDPFVARWSFDPAAAPTVVTPELAQWQLRSGPRSVMSLAIKEYVWEARPNFSDQVFDNGVYENVISNFRMIPGACSASCSTIFAPTAAALFPAVAVLSWRVDATGRGATADFSWPAFIDFARWDSGEVEIYEEGVSATGQPYSLSVFGDIAEWRLAGASSPRLLIGSLATAVEQLDLPPGFTDSLNEKLRAAAGLLANPNRNSSSDAALRGVLRALINQIRAERGGQISETDAALLENMALLAIAALSNG